MSLEFSIALSRQCHRLVKDRPALALMAAKLSGNDSCRPADHRYAAAMMAMEFVRAGWKPRLRVKAGRREWSLPCPA